MQNSEAYLEFIDDLKKEGFQKKDGYNPKLLKEIYDWERSDVEDKIWVKFHENDGSLVDFLPQLKKYDGITALKNCKYLKNIPSFASVNTARVLYECTLDSKYLFIIKDNINTAKDSMEYVSILVRCTPSATWKARSRPTNSSSTAPRTPRSKRRSPKPPSTTSSTPPPSTTPRI